MQDSTHSRYTEEQLKVLQKYQEQIIEKVNFHWEQWNTPVRFKFVVNSFAPKLKRDGLTMEDLERFLLKEDKVLIKSTAYSTTRVFIPRHVNPDSIQFLMDNFEEEQRSYRQRYRDERKAKKAKGEL